MGKVYDVVIILPPGIHLEISHRSSYAVLRVHGYGREKNIEGEGRSGGEAASLEKLTTDWPAFVSR